MGLEDRVLTRLATQAVDTRYKLWPAIAAVTTAFVVAVALVTTHFNDEKPQVANGAPAPGVTHSASGPSGIQEQTAKRVRPPSRPGAQAMVARRSQHRQQHSPRLAVFPTPSAETEQERILAKLATSQYAAELVAVSQNVGAIRSLEIPPLEIAPLSVGTELPQF
jgi:hypothetical protein